MLDMSTVQLARWDSFTMIMNTEIMIFVYIELFTNAVDNALQEILYEWRGIVCSGGEWCPPEAALCPPPPASSSNYCPLHLHNTVSSHSECHYVDSYNNLIFFSNS